RRVDRRDSSRKLPDLACSQSQCCRRNGYVCNGSSLSDIDQGHLVDPDIACRTVGQVVCKHEQCLIAGIGIITGVLKWSECLGTGRKVKGRSLPVFHIRRTSVNGGLERPGCLSPCNKTDFICMTDLQHEVKVLLQLYFPPAVVGAANIRPDCVRSRKPGILVQCSCTATATPVVEGPIRQSLIELEVFDQVS